MRNWLGGAELARQTTTKQQQTKPIDLTRMNSSKVAAVLGVGPGLGSALARKFAKEGYTVVIMSRRMENLTPVKTEIEQNGGKVLPITVDATSEESMKLAFEKVRSELNGSMPSLFVFNAGARFMMKSLLDTSLEEFKTCFDGNCTGCFIAAKEVLPDMVKNKRGTFLITGATASWRGGAKFVNLAVGKFGLRALAQSMAREYGPQGIHVSHIVVDGQIDTGSEFVKNREKHTLLNPDRLADVYWNLHCQDPTVWTFELDVRPHVEKW